MVRTVASTENVDQSLEDIVQSQLKAKRGARQAASGPKHGSPPKAHRQERRRGSVGKTRVDSFDVAENGAQRTNLFAGARRGQSPPAGGSNRRDNEKTKMIVSNLDYQVTQRDMEELFGEFPDFSKAALHFDSNGRSLGTCELVFRSRSGAQKAIKQYNNVPLDGKSMKIEVVGSPIVQSGPVSSRLGARQSSPPRARRESPPSGGGRRARGGRGGRGRGGDSGSGNGRPKREEKKEMTAEELDKELDNYLAAGSK